jgi:hypothetical protein
MTKEEKLESVVNWYRQQLADSQLQVASANATIQEQNAEITRLTDEMEEYYVWKKQQAKGIQGDTD